MYRNLPAPIQCLFRRDASIFEPALIEKFGGAIRSSRPYHGGKGVNYEANILPLLKPFETTPTGDISGF
jgi:hypothetical protein